MRQIVLRDYQCQSVDGLRQGIRAGHRRQILVAPTGAGKTEIACHMLAEADRKGTRSLFIVDRRNLVEQTSQRLDSYGIGHGVIQAGHPRMRLYERIQVCSAQTIERRGIPEDVGLVFIDECHELRRVITQFALQTSAVVIGLSATPFAKGLGEVYSHMVNVTTTNDLIAQGFLVPLRQYAARSISVAGLKVVAGEWAEDELAARGMEIVGDIVSEWQDKTTLHFGGPVKTIVFSANVAHGAEVARQFKAAGYRFEQVSYKDGDDASRDALIAEFRKPDSSIIGLIACEVLTKGFDVSDVRCGISARPYRKSLSSHIQQLGRVMRPAPDKGFGLWLDHSGNLLRFRKDVERVFEEGVHDLAAGKLLDARPRSEPEEGETKDIRCSCGCVLLPSDKACPGCGKERRQRSDIEMLPGRMVEVTGKGAKAVPAFLADRDAVWRQVCNVAKARSRGNSDKAVKMAAAKYRALYEHYGLKEAPPRPYDAWSTEQPSLELRKRLRHMDLKFHRSRSAQRTAAA